MFATTNATHLRGAAGLEGETARTLPTDRNGLHTTCAQAVPEAQNDMAKSTRKIRALDIGPLVNCVADMEFMETPRAKSANRAIPALDAQSIAASP